MRETRCGTCCCAIMEGHAEFRNVPLLLRWRAAVLKINGSSSESPASAKFTKKINPNYFRVI